MKNFPTVRLVFDRKKTATKKTTGLVQIEVRFNGGRKFISTGVKVYVGQWDNMKWVVRCADGVELNKSLRLQVQALEKFINESHPFSWDKLEGYIKGNGGNDNFVDFVSKTIDSRNDIGEGTRKSHRKLVGALKSFGGITYYHDLTKSNVLAFDNWLHGRKIRKLDKDGNEMFVPMKTPSIYGYHKLMKTYIHIAMNMELVKSDPYYGMRFQKGESEPGRYVSKEELERLMKAPMRSGSVARARDMFVFQSFTGLAYADLKLFDFTKAAIEGNDYVYSGKRKKTGEEFFFVILKPAMKILKKYSYVLPVTSSQTYDSNLKKVAADAGIDKPLASHWARRTAGMMLLNAGVRLETVAKILGHSSVKTTEQFYADIQKKTVIEEMKKAGL